MKKLFLTVTLLCGAQLFGAADEIEQSRFANLKAQYLNAIKDLIGLPDDIRNQWFSKLANAQNLEALVPLVTEINNYVRR